MRLIHWATCRGSLWVKTALCILIWSIGHIKEQWKWPWTWIFTGFRLFEEVEVVLIRNKPGTAISQCLNIKQWSTQSCDQTFPLSQCHHHHSSGHYFCSPHVVPLFFTFLHLFVFDAEPHRKEGVWLLDNRVRKVPEIVKEWKRGLVGWFQTIPAQSQHESVKPWSRHTK